MIERDNGTIRTVAWAELFPWLGIVRCFRLAIAARVLLLGAVGILVTAICWGVVGSVFGTDSRATVWLVQFKGCPWKAATEIVPDKPMFPTEVGASGKVMEFEFDTDVSKEPGALTVGGPETRTVYPLWRPRDPVSGPWALLSSPATEGLSGTGLPVRAVASMILCGLLAAAVWAFFGAAICRIAAVQLATGEQVGLGAALRYACRKWPAYFAAPLLPVGGVLLATLTVLVLAWLMRLVGLWLGIFFWPLVLVAGLFMALLLLGLLFGWPLMWATISAEGTDSFDALSRAYAYTFQRPLHYLFYSVVAAFIGWLGWLLVQNFAAGVVWMGYWAAAWGCSADQLDALLKNGQGFSVGAIHFWAGCVKLLAVGYLFSYFFTASAAVYFLLRRDVDATEMDEVFLDADLSEQAAGLPIITTDQAGTRLSRRTQPRPHRPRTAARQNPRPQKAIRNDIWLVRQFNCRANAVKRDQP